MNLGRLLLKLRYDRPGDLAAKLVGRWTRPRANRRRRARWLNHPGVASSDIPADFSPAGAERLWPGAADRSWLVAARQRWPVEHAAAAELAAAAAAGRFDLLGSGPRSVLDEHGRIRWHDDFKSGASFPADRLYLDVPICLPQEGTDIKVPWELSRFQHCFAGLWTIPEQYRGIFLRQWEDWIGANPVARGPNWACAMDVALRAITWTAALAAWGRSIDQPDLRRLAASLATHGHFVRDNLEWVSGPRTNHYFTDIIGLAVLGAVLPDYPPAGEWLDFAARELRREILEQFAPDGFDRECSTTYHRLMLELAVVGYRACAVGGDPLGPEARARLLAGFQALAALADSSGGIPLIGDNDSGRVFPMVPRPDTDVGHVVALGAAALETGDLPHFEPGPEAVLLCGPRAMDRHAARAAATSAQAVGAALPDSGLFVLGNSRDHLVIRCGPLTYRPVGSHRHLDQLSLTLSLDGRPLLVDPGQYCYTPWPEWRNRFLVSELHNTVTVDDQPQCRMFLLDRMCYTLIEEARPACLTWAADAQRARFAGMHRGYRRLSGGGDHLREVSYDLGEHVWLVRDRLALSGSHRVVWRFCLHPDAKAAADGEGWTLTNGPAKLSLRCPSPQTMRGVIEPGWYAPGYGRKVETNVLVFRRPAEGEVIASFELRRSP